MDDESVCYGLPRFILAPLLFPCIINYSARHWIFNWWRAALLFHGRGHRPSLTLGSCLVHSIQLTTYCGKVATHSEHSVFSVVMLPGYWINSLVTVLVSAFLKVEQRLFLKIEIYQTHQASVCALQAIRWMAQNANILT